MSDEIVGPPPVVFSSKERAALVAQALSDAARRARFSTKRRRGLALGTLRERRGIQMMRLLKAWTFIGVVLVPCAAFAAYIYLVASPQYVAEARFTVRGGLPSSIDQMGKLTGAPSLLIIQDTQVILNFLESRSMVEHLDRSIDFETLYDAPSIDYFSRLKPDQAIERVVKYWKKHTSVNVQMPSGIVTFSVRAFSAADAVRVADAALEASEDLVNQMNDKMRIDAVALADSERQRAEANLAAARTNLERARNEEGMLSASEESKGLTALIQSVQEQALKLQQEYDSQRRYVSADAPQLKNLQTRLDAAQKEVVALRAQMTRTSVANAARKNVLSGSMSRLDFATLQNTTAEKIFAASLTALEQAHVASESKLMYINTFVQPVAAQWSEYPKRGLDLFLFSLAALGTWIVVLVGLILGRMVSS